MNICKIRIKVTALLIAQVVPVVRKIIPENHLPFTATLMTLYGSMCFSFFCLNHPLRCNSIL